MRKRMIRDEKAKEARPELDEKDAEIIRCMRDKPEIRIKELAKTIHTVGGVEEKMPLSTVQKRVDRLKKKEVVKEIYAVNLKKIGYPLRCRIDIQIESVEIRDKRNPEITSQRDLAKYIVEKLAKEKPYVGRIIVDDVFVLLGGPSDMSLDIRASDNEIVSHFVTEALRKTYGIRNTTTSHLTESYMNGKASGFTDHSDISQGETREEGEENLRSNDGSQSQFC
jgi:DNA-binding Lrp family transcriptional regulator